ncbi:hypothetical protein DFJ73DRAFT_623214 [Zopfochytrium polystomum]|nr:hypothetical protein DFJ73DRAFT_623214 [Zopfochytrium polystomum]
MAYAGISNSGNSQSITSSTANGSVRTVSETTSTIAYEMRWVLCSILMNGVLIYAVIVLQQNTLLQIDASLISHYGGVFIEVVLLLSNLVTMRALQQGAAVVFGYLLCSKSGFSLVSCGFLMTPPLGKLKFAQSLSLTSPARKKLQRISFLWIVGDLLKLATPFCAVALYSTAEATFNDVSDCITFIQDPINGPVDRAFPTFEVETGVAEYVFGNSIGLMRSQDSSLKYTTAMFPPTLISPFNDGDTIHGPGFTVDIFSTCTCARNATANALENAGIHPSQSAKILDFYFAKRSSAGITFGVVVNNDSLIISNLLLGYPLCGGAMEHVSFPMVCSTKLWNHRSALLEILFRTDGSVSSIAPNHVYLDEFIELADMQGLGFAFNALVEGPVSYFRLPALVPGSINPLLWWATPNLNNIDRALLDAGVETMYSVLFKAAIQRTYQSNAMQCPRMNVVLSHISTIHMGKEGLIVAMGLLGAQLLVALMAAAAFILWFTSPNPIGPAVRATTEYIYLLTLLAPTQMTVGLGELGNAETYSIWQELDVIVRIGESIHTLDNQVGQLVIDKPSMVRPIQNGRKYI